MEVALLPAELTVTGGGVFPDGVAVGPTGVLVGLGVVVVPVMAVVPERPVLGGAVMAVVPERPVLGGGVKVRVAVEKVTVALVTVVFWNPGPVVVWLFGGGTANVVVVVTGGGVWMLRVHGQLVMVIVVGVVTV
jgi:hypothetical protein